MRAGGGVIWGNGGRTHGPSMGVWGSGQCPGEAGPQLRHLLPTPNTSPGTGPPQVPGQILDTGRAAASVSTSLSSWKPTEGLRLSFMIIILCSVQKHWGNSTSVLLGLELSHKHSHNAGSRGSAESSFLPSSQRPCMCHSLLPASLLTITAPHSPSLTLLQTQGSFLSSSNILSSFLWAFASAVPSA